MSIIISNDPDLKICSYENAKGILLNILRNRNYESLKDCVYDLYGSFIYNAIDSSYRSRILYEYFTKKEEELYYKIVNDMSDDICTFDDFRLHLKLSKDYKKEIDQQNIYELYIRIRNKKYKEFSKSFILNKYTIYTSLEDIKNLPHYNEEFYYQILNKISEENGFSNCKEKVLRFYFSIQDFYFKGKIYLNMNFEDFKNNILDHPLYIILKKSKYKSADIYYLFMINLEEKLKGI